MATFTLAQYNRNENRNLHTENALQLVKMFGTEEEIKIMERISADHKKQGFITNEQYQKRYDLSGKYYSKLI